MALITRAASASGDTVHLQKVMQLSGDEYAGEALDPVAPIYKKASDGLWYMCNGTAATEPALCWGFSAHAIAIGNPVTAYGIGARFGYGTGLTVGNKLFVGATAGRLDTAATTGGLVAIARVISATDIQVIALT